MTAPFHAEILTLYPEMFPGPLSCSLSGRALERGIWSLHARSIRDYATGRHQNVDDTPFGGGAGMVLRADVLGHAVDAALEDCPGLPLIYLTPKGTPLNQKLAENLAAGPGVMLLCGRFEGVDQRILERRPFIEVSLGDFILSGGEIAALCLLDSVVRLLPNVVGSRDSIVDESFSFGLLEHPHYTRPQIWEGMEVPPVLLSGHHDNISKWRREQAERLTKARRPDLFRHYLNTTNLELQSGTVTDSQLSEEQGCDEHYREA